MDLLGEGNISFSPNALRGKAKIGQPLIIKFEADGKTPGLSKWNI
jgi:hypothetical protein